MESDGVGGKEVADSWLDKVFTKALALELVVETWDCLLPGELHTER